MLARSESRQIGVSAPNLIQDEVRLRSDVLNGFAAITRENESTFSLRDLCTLASLRQNDPSEVYTFSKSEIRFIETSGWEY